MNPIGKYVGDQEDVSIYVEHDKTDDTYKARGYTACNVGALLTFESEWQDIEEEAIATILEMIEEEESDETASQEGTITALKYAASNPLAGTLQKNILETVAYMVEVKGIEYALAYVSEQLPQQVGMNGMLAYGKAKTILEDN